jgi:signal transduction histidine kinase
VVLLAVLLALGAGYVTLTLFSTQMYLAETSQRLNRDLAAHLTRELPLMRGGEVNQQALDRAFHMMMVINPRIEIYLLDDEGRILAFSAKPDKIKRQSVSLAPIREFLDPSSRLPIWGDDPRRASQTNIFSAAPVMQDGSLGGYLYVVLAGEQHASMAGRIQQSHVLRLSLGVLAGSLLVALVLGLVLFGRITGPVRRLESRVAAFDASGFRELPADWSVSEGGNDELSRLDDRVRRMGARILEQIERLRAIDQNRRDLVATVSHDLRTPLSALRGYLETLQLKADRLSEEERSACVRTALRQAERLSELIDALFELAKLEAQGRAPRCEAFAMSDLVSDLLHEFDAVARERSVELRMVAEEGVPLAWGEVGLISRVLENLIDNAIRYADPGGVVTVRVARAGGGVSVHVEDTGAGIEPAAVNHIFDRFYRAPRDEAAAPGSGLGLAIVKRILDLHGRDIHVSSEPGQGTSFRFELGGPPVVSES